MQSGDGDQLVPVNHRMEIAWSRYINLKRILTSSRLPISLRLRLPQAFVMSTLLYGCESWKLSTQVQRKLNNTVSKTLSRITGRSIVEEVRTPSANIQWILETRWSWIGQILRMDEDRLLRKVLLKCAKPENESLYGDIPDLNVEKAIEAARDRENCKKIRPPRRCWLSMRTLQNKTKQQHFCLRHLIPYYRVSNIL